MHPLGTASLKGFPEGLVREAVPVDVQLEIEFHQGGGHCLTLTVRAPPPITRKLPPPSLAGSRAKGAKPAVGRAISSDQSKRLLQGTLDPSERLGQRDDPQGDARSAPLRPGRVESNHQSGLAG